MVVFNFQDKNHTGIVVDSKLSDLDLLNSNKDSVIDKPKAFHDSSTQTLDFTKTTKLKKKGKDITHNEEGMNTQNDTKAEADIEAKTTGWKSGDNEKSIAEQVKEAALNALTELEKNAGWNIDDNSGDNNKSIAEQVKEVAQNALQQTGMVYVESAGMYYDYKTGYYYNSVSSTIVLRQIFMEPVLQSCPWFYMPVH